MFAKLSIFVASTLAIAAMAAPQFGGLPDATKLLGGVGGVGSVLGGRDISNSCNTGTIQCCNSVQQHTDASRSFFTSFLGVQISDLTGQYAADCSPTTAIGVAGGSSCSSQPVCCDKNDFNGVFALGCNSINA